LKVPRLIVGQASRLPRGSLDRISLRPGVWLTKPRRDTAAKPRPSRAAPNSLGPPFPRNSARLGCIT